MTPGSPGEYEWHFHAIASAWRTSLPVASSAALGANARQASCSSRSWYSCPKQAQYPSIRQVQARHRAGSRTAAPPSLLPMPPHLMSTDGYSEYCWSTLLHMYPCKLCTPEHISTCSGLAWVPSDLMTSAGKLKCLIAQQMSRLLSLGLESLLLCCPVLWVGRLPLAKQGRQCGAAVSGAEVRELCGLFRTDCSRLAGSLTARRMCCPAASQLKHRFQPLSSGRSGEILHAMAYEAEEEEEDYAMTTGGPIVTLPGPPGPRTR